MFERFAEHLGQKALIPPSTPVLVGLSGGADSLALLHLLKRLGHDVAAGHLHHGLRPEADEEASALEKLCDVWKVPLVVGKADVRAIQAAFKVGEEEAGRKARYDFLRRSALGLHCTAIATAHTRDDLVETALFNWVRGSGMAGLAGVPERNGNVVRPLLPFSREETRAYCTAEGLEWFEDPANSNLAFHRVRLRREVLPVLRTLRQNADEAVYRASQIFREEDDYLNSVAAAFLEQIATPLNGRLAFLTEAIELELHRQPLLLAPRALRRRALRLAMRSLGADLDYHLTEAFDAGLGHAPGSLTAPGGTVSASWTEESIHLENLGATTPFRSPIPTPGELDSDEFGWTLRCEPNTSAEFPARTDLGAVVHRAGIRGPLFLRSWEEGDELRPLGFGHRRKLSDLMREAGLTALARRRVPVVCDLLGPLWVPGVALDTRGETDNPLEGCWRLSLRPLEPTGTGHNRNGTGA